MKNISGEVSRTNSRIVDICDVIEWTQVRTYDRYLEGNAKHAQEIMSVSVSLSLSRFNSRGTQPESIRSHLTKSYNRYTEKTAHSTLFLPNKQISFFFLSFDLIKNMILKQIKQSVQFTSKINLKSTKSIYLFKLAKELINDGDSRFICCT